MVFRTCDALVRDGSFAIGEGLAWRGFGTAPGRDGGLHSVFGPLQAIGCVPFVWLGDVWLGDDEARAARVPAGISYHVDGGLLHAARGSRPADPLPHARRFFASWLNVVAGAAGALAFLLLAGTVAGRAEPALGAALLFAVGSLAWPYAGTFFSEPLAAALAIGALALLARADPRLPGARGGGPIALAGAGLAAGLSTAAHLTSALFLPPFVLYAAAAAPPGRRWRRAAAFVAGAAPPLAALALHNLLRFGSLFETGRGVDPAAAAALGYGRFVAPWEGLAGLLVSSGKGLLFYAPAILLGVVAWPALRRRSPALAGSLAGAVLLRVLFVATRSDWHGGFALGPRLLVTLVPFLLLPVAAWLAERTERWRVAGAVLLAAAAQQLYFALAEPFVYLHLTNRPDGDWAWQVSPLLHLWEAPLAPFWLAGRGVPLALAWVAGALVLLPALALALRRLARGAARAEDRQAS
ncbi:MAG: hypothetical protein M5U13_12740 [Thermoanaerobaculia bacterium]|nr:hypothetical protein [Thermoanaerobaculia bacterium]